MSLTRGHIATEDDVIQNSKLGHLYTHAFESGRFFQVVFEDDKEVNIKLARRTLLKVVYLTKKDDLEGLEIIKMVSNSEKQKLQLSKFNLQQLKSFLSFIERLDLKGITERRITLADDSLDVLDAETRKKVATLLSGSEGIEIVKEILENGLITSQDIVNTGYRKQQLEIFRKLLEEDYLAEYKNSIGKSNTKDETAWQHFFYKNQWIFGYGLDYRFQGVLQKEFYASDSNADGSNSVIADFLIGDNQFATFVELKLPTTELFGKEKNRSNSWRLSNSLIDSVSQILEQKASGQIKIETNKELIADNGEPITQNAYDSKTILVIGNWKELEADGETFETRKIKKKTLELFRRDSRNVKIITYDELYERASFIAKNNSE